MLYGASFDMASKKIRKTLQFLVHLENSKSYKYFYNPFNHCDLLS